MIKRLVMVIVFLLMVTPVHAQNAVRTELLEADIIAVESINDTNGEYQKLTLRIESGILRGQIVSLTSNDYAGVHVPVYKLGDVVLVRYEVTENGETTYLIQDYLRTAPLLWLLVLFVLLSVIVGGKHGVRSLIGLAFSFLVIITFILPQIKAGAHPGIVAVVGASVIALVTFYISHGVNRKTTTAILGTFVAFVCSAILAEFFIKWSRLSGYSSDESLFLQISQGDVVNIQGLILAGIIIGALGILDDVTVSQASIVQELKYANSSLRKNELFFRAMRVGTDHIASLVNTLVLVYTASSLPLLLLYLGSDVSFVHFVNYEVVAEEIIRTLTASIGLIIAVPVTTFIAVRYVDFEKPKHSH